MEKVLTRVLLIRHGEVENPEGILIQRLPGFHLSKVGIEQVNSLASILKQAKFNIGLVYSSPLERALETAEIISKKLGGVKVEVREELNEVNNPALQGKSKLARLFLLVMNGFNSYSKHFIDLGGEKPEEVILRTRGLLTEVLEKHKEEVDIAFVFHADPIRLLLWSFQNHRREETITSRKLKDHDYLRKAEAIVLNFDKQSRFCGFEHIKHNANLI